MNRRSLFAFLAAVPLAAAAAKEIVNAEPTVPKPEFPIGHLTDTYEIVPDYDPGHNHTMMIGTPTPQHTGVYPHIIGTHQHASSSYYPSRAVVRRKIYDGKQFVDFDSPAGAAVYNSLIAKFA